MCKKVTTLIEVSLILLSLCICFFTANSVFANQFINSSYGSTVVKLTIKKIKKINIRTEGHKAFVKTERINDDNDVIDDQDNPDYSFNCVNIIKSQVIKNQTNSHNRYWYRYSHKVHTWSTIRC